ncbi:hypothetical protein GCM10012275_52520 [Longimycelium tulufanense]|uniref:RDD domain-containing protein n=1 Tax=Longimycelium tulufanense TaxID=907463 RepID=A0A8J3CCY4_9PSEU|nr:RDD family protein [Longimycelium tulufanense]GGM75350.1 hypothetical protein GCM10012275_52520 [Longimycelium tulufanense]
MNTPHGRPPQPPRGWRGPAAGPSGTLPNFPMDQLGPAPGGYPPPPEPRYGPPPTARPATVGQRVVARLVDGVVVAAPSTLLLFLLNSWTPTLGQALFLLPFFMLVIGGAYEVTMLTEAGGATLGKRMTGIAVVRADAEPLDTRTAVVRWGSVYGGLLIPFIGTLFTVLMVLSPFFDKSGRYRGWYDRAAHTLVVATR